MTRSAWADILWLLLCGTLSSWWAVTSARQIGPTFDEPVYVEKGLERAHTGKIGGLMKLGTMPLPVDVQTFPVRVWGWWRGQAFTLDDLPAVLPVFRAANLVFWWLLLLYALLAARSLGGPWAGRIAVTFLALEPTFLAHASLATTDISVAACVLAFAYHFWQGRDEEWTWRVLVPGLWMGLAALAKASGPVFAVLCMFAIELQRRWGRTEAPRIPFRHDFVHIGLIGVAVMFVYCGSDWQPQPDALRWANSLPEGVGKPLAFGAVKAFPIFPNAAEGFVRQVTHNARGHGAYLLGVESKSAIWWYFPVTLTIKLTVPLLLLAAAVLLFARRQAGNAALAAAAALLAFSVTCRVQIGVRFMLPLVALAIVGLSAAAARAMEARPTAWAAGLAAALLVNLAGAYTAWPNGLGYINSLYGGPERGQWAVSDSNLDWGQGVPELARWARENSPGPLAVWYYGADPAVKRPPFQPVQLHEGDIDANLRALEGRWLAVSACLAWGPPLTPQVVEARRKLDRMTPVARTRTFVLYRLPEERVAGK
jgi:hypothetical protein